MSYQNRIIVFRLEVILFALILCSCAHGQVASQIKVNQVGYLQDNVKFGYISSDQALSIGTWHLYDIDNNVVAFTGSGYTKVVDDVPTEELVYQLEFSDFNSLGNYYLSIDGIGQSHDFLISSTTYNEVFRKIMKGFYYQRSGEKLTSTYAGQWRRPAEYDEDAYIYTGYDGTNITYSNLINTAGGWRDAGDPNKKVVPAAISVHQLMMLFEHFPTETIASDWNIPDDGDITGLPDLLIEIKVCIDWMLKMQRADGAVYHAVTQADFYLAGMGHEDPNRRYLMPVSTTATASFAAALAQASRIFENIDNAYSNLCLSAATNAWKAIGTNSIWNNPTINGPNGTPLYPELHGYSVDPPGINLTANYVDTDDTDEIYWASIELFLATQEVGYYDYFAANIETGIYYPSLWSEVANMASFSYVMGMKDTNETLSNTLKMSVASFADAYIARSDTTGYGMSLTASDYFWGSNNVVGQFAYMMILAYEITGNLDYKNQALNHLNYLLGSNFLNQTFISDVGDQPVANIFHLPSLYDGVAQVVPGLIPGGPNKNLVPSDIVLTNYINAENPPPAGSYVDSEYSFASNETTILESAGWAFVMGYFYNNEVECTAGNLVNEWMGPSTGDWYDDSANWSLLTFPTRCHHVIIPAGKTVTINANKLAHCLTIEMWDDGSINVLLTATLEVQAE